MSSAWRFGWEDQMARKRDQERMNDFQYPTERDISVWLNWNESGDGVRGADLSLPLGGSGATQTWS